MQSVLATGPTRERRMIKYVFGPVLGIISIIFLAVYLCVAILHVILGCIRRLMDLAINKLIEMAEPDV